MDEEALVTALAKGSVVVLAKPGAKKTEILGFDVARKAFRIAIAAKAEDNKANRELVKFLSKLLGRRVHIKTGLTSKEKVIV